jgi:hypothetical protein
LATYIKRKSKKQEEATAKQFGGKVQPASGAMYFAKADVRTGETGVGFNDSDFLIENKYTDKASYSLKKQIWEKIEKEALKDNMRTPLMQIDIQDKQLVVLNKSDFLSLIEKN